MKILSNFNTNLDYDYINKNSLVVKNYFMYLFTWSRLSLYLSFILILNLFFFLQHQVFGGLLGEIINYSYIIIFLFWLFFHLSFLMFYIRKHKVFYDIHNKHLLKESDKKFDRALKISILVLFLNSLLSGIGFFYLFYVGGGTQDLIVSIAYIIVNAVLILIQWLIIKKALIDFEMDFIVLDIEVGEIIQVGQTALFNKKTDTARLDLIVAINTSSKGILRSALDFGSLKIVKPSGERDLLIDYVKAPGHLERVMKLSMEKYKTKGSKKKDVK